jgi:hypothetical protein
LLAIVEKSANYDGRCHPRGVEIARADARAAIYIIENEIVQFLRGHGRRLFVHSVLTGGQAMSDTLNGLERLAETTAEKNVIVWLNEFFGEVTRDGKTFDEFKIAEDLAPKLLGTVVIRQWNPDTFGDDIRQMLERRMTFDEAIRISDFWLLSKQCLAMVRRELFEQLDKLAMD